MGLARLYYLLAITENNHISCLVVQFSLYRKVRKYVSNFQITYNCLFSAYVRLGSKIGPFDRHNRHAT